MTNEEIVCRIQRGEDLYGELIEKNQGLFLTLHREIDKMKILEEDDALSACYECTFRCVSRWKKDRGIQFVTFLYPSLVHEIRKQIKRELKYRGQIDCSLDFQITTDQGEASRLVDVMFSKRSKSLSKFYTSDREIIKRVAFKHFKTLPYKQRLIAQAYFFEGVGQVELSECFGISQSAISRTLTKVKKSAKQDLQQHGLNIFDFHRAMSE